MVMCPVIKQLTYNSNISFHSDTLPGLMSYQNGMLSGFVHWESFSCKFPWLRASQSFIANKPTLQ